MNNNGSIKFGLNNPFWGIQGQVNYLSLSAKKDGRFGANLGCFPAFLSPQKIGVKEVAKEVSIICEQTINSAISSRESHEFVVACHAGSCEFESRPSRINPQESNLEGFSMPKTPRQTSPMLVASVVNKKTRNLHTVKSVLLYTGGKIGVNFLQKKEQNEAQKSSKKHN